MMQITRVEPIFRSACSEGHRVRFAEMLRLPPWTLKHAHSSMQMWGVWYVLVRNMGYYSVFLIQSALTKVHVRNPTLWVRQGLSSQKYVTSPSRNIERATFTKFVQFKLRTNAEELSLTTVRTLVHPMPWTEPAYTNTWENTEQAK